MQSTAVKSLFPAIADAMTYYAFFGHIAPFGFNTSYLADINRMEFGTQFSLSLNGNISINQFPDFLDHMLHPSSRP